MIGTDPYIQESIKAGHTWAVKDFDTDGGHFYVPYTTSTKGYWMIPTHTYAKPSAAIGNLVANGIDNVTTYAGFTGGTALPEYSGTATSIKTVSHDVNGALTAAGNDEVTLDDYYVVNSSCEINVGTYNKIFVDPSALTGSDTIKIVLKGHPARSGDTIDFVVNNTATYTNGYSNPTPYINDNKFVARSQVRVFLKDDFGNATDADKMDLYMRTTGILRQWNASNMSVVQKPTYPDDANWVNLGNKVKYAYELVPNFTVYGEAGHTYNFSGNAAMLNADVAMPMSNLVFGTVNSGNRYIEYRETCDVTDPSKGETYVWAVGSFMIGTVDMNDRCAMTAYIGSIGSSSNPPRRTTEDNGGNDSDANGENNNQFFQPTVKGAG